MQHKPFVSFRGSTLDSDPQRQRQVLERSSWKLKNENPETVSGIETKSFEGKVIDRTVLSKREKKGQLRPASCTWEGKRLQRVPRKACRLQDVLARAALGPSSPFQNVT